MIDTVGILQNVLLMRMRFKNEIHASVRERDVIKAFHRGIVHVARASVAADTVVHSEYDIVAPCGAKPLGLRSHERAQLCADLEFDPHHLILADGGMAIADRTDDPDPGIAAGNGDRGRGKIHARIGRRIINIDRKEGKVRQGEIFADIIVRPVEFVVSECHCRGADRIEPFGHHSAAREIGLRGSLPHIAVGKHDRMIVRLSRVGKIGRQLIHAGLRIRIGKLSMKIVDGIKIDDNDDRSVT